MIAFVSSTVFLLVLMGGAMQYGKRRPIGTPLTWAEAMIGALFVFAVFFLAYGIVPDAFLRWADGPLKWRSDAKGIPIGPLRHLMNKKWNNHWYSYEKNSLWPKGVTFFGRARITIVKEHVRDFVAANIYIVLLGVQIKLWAAWQKRGKKAAASAAVEPTSAFGRPLVRQA